MEFLPGIPLSRRVAPLGPSRPEPRRWHHVPIGPAGLHRYLCQRLAAHLRPYTGYRAAAAALESARRGRI